MDNEMPPVSIDKIIDESKQWTLEGDCTLLQWMNQISRNLEERVTQTSSALNDMSTKLDRTSIALSNVTNNLAALQYSKFVENRVHDDDETITSLANVPSEDVTDRKEPVQDICSFLKKNLEMMNSCHEAYSISYDDSDDDDDEPTTNVVYRSKNPYEARPLPHIYGSNMWKEKWHIGLCDSDNDFSGDENSEQFSESSSTADDSYESTAPTMSEWDSTAWGLNTHHNVERKEMRTPSNDEESSYQGEDYSQSKVSTPRPQRSISNVQQPILDSRYYMHVPRRQESLFDDIFNDSKQKEVTPQGIPPQVTSPQVVSAPQKKIIPESYIPNEPPPDEQPIESDSNRRVGAKKTLNLFDDDEFSSFMDQIVQKATNKGVKPNEQPQITQEPPKKASGPNLFNDFDDDIPAKDEPKNVVAANLFSDSDDQTPSPVDTQKQPTKNVVPNLFSDSDDLFSVGSQKSLTPPKKMTAANLFDDSDDLFNFSAKEHEVLKRKSSPLKIDDDFLTAPLPQSTTIGKTKLKNLFDDDDDDDDDFDNIFASKPKESNSVKQNTQNLFADDLDLEPGNTVKNLEKVEVKEKSTKKILDSDDEEITKASVSKDLPVIKSSLNEKVLLDDEDNSTFVLKNERESSIKEVSLLKKDLFDDDDDNLEDENNIFSKKTTKKDEFENLFSKEDSKERFSDIQRDTLFGDMEEDTKEDKLQKEELEEKFEKTIEKPLTNITSPLAGSSPNIPTQTSEGRIDKTEVKNIFSDDFSDDEVPKNATKVDEINVQSATEPQSVAKLMIPPRLPIIAQKPSSFLSNPKNLPVISKKPLVNKTPKPQVNVAEEISGKIDSPEIKQEAKLLNSSAHESAREQDEDVSNSKLSTPDIKAANPLPLSTPAEVLLEAPESIDSNINQNEQSKDTSSHTQAPQIEVNQKEEQDFNSKPIPKPKPSVKFETDRIPTDSPTNTEDNSIKNEPTKKPSAIPSYTSLFHDDLPPEDQSPNLTSNEESPMHTVEEDVEENPAASSSVGYSSINLFADVPPDDDFSVATPPAQTKRIHSIFYDDFHETIEAGREMRAPSSYIINDEPPPDDEVNKKEVKKEKPKIINDAPPSEDKTEVKKEKPKISKLKKMDFQINVGALLPTAKIPSFRKPESIAKPQNEIVVNKEHNADVNPPLVISRSDVPSEGQTVNIRELPENILPNLNRDRAKVQIKRRPSTRKGRQERYRKSMIEETASAADHEMDEDENETTKEINKKMSSSLFDDLGSTKQHETISKSRTQESISAVVSNQDKPIAITKEAFGDFASITQESFKRPNTKDSVGQKLDGSKDTEKPMSTSLFEDFGTLDFKAKTNEDSKETIKQLPDRATLFEESDKFIKNNLTSSSSKVKILPSLFADSDSEPENIFETVKVNKSNEKKSQSEFLPSNKNLNSLFDSDVVDENPFGTPKNFLPKPTMTKDTIKEQSLKPNTTEPLFDSLFDSKQPVEAKAVSEERIQNMTSKTKTSESLFDSEQQMESNRQPAKIFFKPSEEPKKKIPNSSALFGDSDDGSDDLFKAATVSKKAVTQKKIDNKPKTKPTNKQAKQSASLFSSDEEDGFGDDIFGKGKTKVTKKKIEPIKDKISSSLFADLSDDDSDDLFGTSKKKPTGVNKSKPNPPATRTQLPKQTASQAQQAKANSSNPLSDLLGP